MHCKEERNMKKSRVLSVILAAVLAVSVTACGGNETIMNSDELLNCGKTYPA